MPTVHDDIVTFGRADDAPNAIVDGEFGYMVMREVDQQGPARDNPVREALLPKPGTGNFTRRRGSAIADTETVRQILIDAYTSDVPCPPLDKHPGKGAWKHQMPTVAQVCDAYDMAEWVALVAVTGDLHHDRRARPEAGQVHRQTRATTPSNARHPHRPDRTLDDGSARHPQTPVAERGSCTRWT